VFVDPRGGQRVDFELRGSRQVDLHFNRQPGGGPLKLSVDGVDLPQVATEGEPGIDFARVVLPQGAEVLRVVAGGPVKLHAAVLEGGAGGLTWDALGVPGTTASSVLEAHQGDLLAGLRRRDPELLVVMLGLNESHTLKTDEASLSAYRQSYSRLVGSLRAAVPEADCLIGGPMDSGARSTSGAIRSRGVIPHIIEAQRAVALEHGCGFWSLFESMGGEGSIKTWFDAGLAFPDLYHPSNDGGPVMGYLLSEALLASYRDGPTSLLGRAPGVEHPERLGRFFAALDRFEAGELDEVRALQLGDSHTAADKFPSQLRRLFAKHFGDAGRGLVYPGGPWRTPSPQDVVRTTHGTWESREGLSGGGPFGLAGRSATSTSGRLTLSPCMDCPQFQSMGSLDVYWHRRPDGGRIRVSSGDAQLFEADTSEGDSALGSARVALPVGAEQVAIAAGGAPVTVLGAALHSGHRGVIWESAGLSGAFAWSALAWDETLHREALAARDPQLVTLVFGTNEAREPGIDEAAYGTQVRDLIRRVQEAAPQSDCLLVGPLDVMVGSDEAGWEVPSHLADIQRIQRAAADELGCAYWDAQAAMGGPGVIDSWVPINRAHPDHIHLRKMGYRWVGQALFDDLMAARAGRQ